MADRAPAAAVLTRSSSRIAPSTEQVDGAIVVPDLDGTLVAGDAFGGFLMRSLRRNPFRLLAVALSAPVWGCVGLRRGGRARAELLSIASITLGRSPSALQRAFDEFAVDHVRRGRIDVALARLARHLEAGDEVVVATACAEPSPGRSAGTSDSTT